VVRAGHAVAVVVHAVAHLTGAVEHGRRAVVAVVAARGPVAARVSDKAITVHVGVAERGGIAVFVVGGVEGLQIIGEAQRVAVVAVVSAARDRVTAVPVVVRGDTALGLTLVRDFVTCLRPVARVARAQAAKRIGAPGAHPCTCLRAIAEDVIVAVRVRAARRAFVRGGITTRAAASTTPHSANQEHTPHEPTPVVPQASSAPKRTHAPR